jgi:SWI/SNF-related matrix-associated actin-dependent regulator 1 of chromatin subfamily A
LNTTIKTNNNKQSPTSGTNRENELVLYPFQREAVKFIDAANGRALLGDEMGLGRTVEALTWIRKQRHNINKVLIVCPANVTYKWLREISTWTERRDAVLVTGYKSKIGRSNTIICSYNVMTKRWKELEALGFDCVIWDEAHYLKGNRKKTKRVAAALRLKSPYVLFLTGTPFLNRPIELFNILTMLEPGKWKLGSYGTRYCGGFDHWEGPLKGATNRDELKSKLTSIMIRRLKREVLDELPDLSRTLLPIDIRTVEYREAMKNIDREFPMRTVMDMWKIIGEEKAKVAIEWARDWLTNSEDSAKLLLYCHHLSVADTLVSGLKDFGAAAITGNTSPEMRDIRAHHFQVNSTGQRCLIINKAGGEGIDLFGIGGVDASTILFVERQWTPALEEQALARLDRIGQKNAVSATYL